MATSNFNLRNINSDMMSALKAEAAKQKTSVNSLILLIIARRLEMAQPVKKNLFHDLDYLAGIWSDKDKKTFNSHIKPFEKIDEKLWI